MPDSWIRWGSSPIYGLRCLCRHLYASVYPRKAKLMFFFPHVPSSEEYQKLCIQIPDGNGGVLIPRVPGSPDIPGIYPFPFPGQPNGRGEGPGVPEIPIQGTGHIPGQVTIPGVPYPPPPPGMLQLFACLLIFLQFYTHTCAHMHARIDTPTSEKFQHDVYFQLLS